MERLIIFGGTFDPIHNGHLRLARAASFLLNGEVVFVPAKTPRWKTPEASAEDRLAMLRAALAEDKSGNFAVSTVEMDRGEESHTIDTVEYFAQKYPHRELVVLIGADEANKFAAWYEAKRLSEIAKIVYVSRPGETVDEAVAKEYRLERLPFDGSGEVSSSEIRLLHTIDTPISVLSYIEDHRLYFMKKLAFYLSDKRLLHSLSVGHLAYAIAASNQVKDPQKAYIAGALHDIGKRLPEDEAVAILKDNYPDAIGYPEWAYHQWTGAYLATKDFGITDEEILDAIRYHCTGKTHMPPLTKIIYSADKIEPTRGYDSKKLINRCLKNYYVGFLSVLKENRVYLKSVGYDDNTPLSQACYNLYLGGK
jgi:nicotinate-nucleotide adenylyltransferase